MYYFGRDHYMRNILKFCFSTVCLFVQWSGTVCAILVKAIMRNISMKLFLISI